MGLFDGLTKISSPLSSNSVSGLDNISNNSLSSVQSCTSGQFATNLADNGFTQEEIDDILSKLPSDFLTKDSAAMSSALADTMKASKEGNIGPVTGTVTAVKVDEIRKQQVSKINNHETQEAKASVSLTESYFGGPFDAGGKQVNQPQANYSLEESYPNSYGMIDDAKNWYKIDKIKKTVEFVHPSGTSMKVDQYGNVTMDIAGSLKFIIAGDCATEVRGSDDKIVRHNSNQLTMGDLMLKVAGKSLFQVAGESVMLGNPIKEN